mgnify:CR=1 FL=1
MVQDLGRIKETPSQTAGPYVHIGLTPNFCGIGGVYDADLGTSMVNDKTRGERISSSAASTETMPRPSDVVRMRSEICSARSPKKPSPPCCSSTSRAR